MIDLFLAPHNDDETLFGAFTLLRRRPHVIVCLRSRVQERYGITATQRERETDAAMQLLGCNWEQWNIRDINADAQDLIQHLRRFDPGAVHRDVHVFAPAIEEGGHHDHNLVGEVARYVFGPERVTHYLTYTRHGGKSEIGAEVYYEPAWVTLKLRALACYRSQIETAAAGCTPHFIRDQREWYQA